MGDLSENAEYSEAKDEQALNEGRIVELRACLKMWRLWKTAARKEK